jgi:formate-dependent nitrite reductase cytochrome c552 subunit
MGQMVQGLFPMGHQVQNVMKHFDMSCNNCHSDHIDIFCNLNEDILIECLNCGQREMLDDET